jgi:tetratricopeptide (TPR) repeat protein
MPKQKPCSKKQWHQHEKNFGEDHPTTAICYNNLALVLQDLGEYAQAKTLFQKAVASDEKNFGEDHPSTAIRYNNLARYYKI